MFNYSPEGPEVVPEVIRGTPINHPKRPGMYAGDIN